MAGFYSEMEQMVQDVLLPDAQGGLGQGSIALKRITSTPGANPWDPPTLGKAMAAGRLRGEELNTVIERGGRVAEILAEQLGVSQNQLRALGAAGKITGDVIYNALTTRLQQLQEEAESMPATIGDGLMLIRNSLLQYVGTMDQATGASASFAAGLIVIADNIGRIVTYGATAVTMYGTYYVAAFVAARVATMGLSGALTLLRGALIKTGIGALVVAAGELVYQFGELVRATGSWGAAMQEVGRRSEILLDAVVWGFRAAGDMISSIWASALASILRNTEAAFGGILRALGVSAEEVSKAVSGLEKRAEQMVWSAESSAAVAAAQFERAFAAIKVDEVADLDTKMKAVAASTGEVNKAAQKAAKAYKEIVDRAQEFIRAQQLEAGLVGMSEQAAQALRFEFDLINDAKRAGIKLTEADYHAFKALAEAMSEAEARVVRINEAKKGWEEVASIAAGMFDKPLAAGERFFDRLISQAAQLGAAIEKAVGGQMGKMLGAGLGGFGAGYQSQNALMGAAGGALSGFMSGGPIGALIGGIGGLIGGIFGQAKRRAEEAKKAAEQLAETERQNAASRLEIARAAYQRETQALRDLAAAHRAYADSIYKTIDAMRLNPAITALNPEQRVDEARRQFEAALKAGPNGDVSGTLQRYAEEALSYFGATETYFDLLARAQDQALAAAKASERTATTAEKQLAAMERQYGKLLGIETGVKSLAAAVRDYEKAQKAAQKASAAVAANNNQPKSFWQRLGAFFGFANGGAFHHGHQITPFANGGIVGRPTLFPMANGAGLMGEAGPEAIMPLRRGRDGKLGVAANSNSTNDNRALENVAKVSAAGSNAIVDAVNDLRTTFDQRLSALERAQRDTASERQRGGRQRVA